MVYLAFYQNPGQPVDFHSKFGNLPRMLTEIYTFPTLTSDTWSMALGTMGNKFRCGRAAIIKFDAFKVILAILNSDIKLRPHPPALTTPNLMNILVSSQLRET
jgi:hypothetical protein